MLVLDNVLLPYLDVYNVIHCLFHNVLLRTGLLFMLPVIVQCNTNVYSNNIQQNIFDAYHLVDFLVHVRTESMSVTNVTHSASRQKFIHASIY